MSGFELSLMAAVSENGVIGSGPDIPWQAKGEQLLFKAMTFNHWLIVGRKTFESMGKLPNRKYAVISRTPRVSDDPDVKYFTDTATALEFLKGETQRAIVAGGGEIYRQLIDEVDDFLISVIHKEVEGDVYFPEMPKDKLLVAERRFESNIDYTFQIWYRMDERKR